MRTSQAQLEKLTRLINKQTNNAFDFSIGNAYGGVRLERKGGSVDVSPRMSTSELRTWMLAYMDGMDLIKAYILVGGIV